MINEIKVEELHPTYQHIAKIIGLENALKLGAECAGEVIYFPKLDSATGPLRRLRNRKIAQEYKTSKCSVLDLSRKYRLTQRQIYTIIHKEGAGRKTLDG